MRNALIIGGGSGIGLSVALALSRVCGKVVIADKKLSVSALPGNVEYRKVNLLNHTLDWLDDYNDTDVLFYSAGFGRIAPFTELQAKEISNSFEVNSSSFFEVLNHFSTKLYSSSDFHCGVMASIAGRIASPLFSIYSATKAALFRGVEAINSELKYFGSPNRILEVSPGSIKGTGFYGGVNDPSSTQELASQIVEAMQCRQTLLIPDYDTIFKGVTARYAANPDVFAAQSLEYKKQSGRMSSAPQLKVGYLSGTFDLFHIGHLNMLRRAKEFCDYLVVGVHKDASHKGKSTFIPFDERKAILESIRFVDKVIVSEKEDVDIYSKGILKYDYLFVGSDYQGSERFKRYEEYFADKDVEIVYFPYTQGTSSTQIRKAIEENTL